MKWVCKILLMNQNGVDIKEPTKIGLKICFRSQITLCLQKTEVCDFHDHTVLCKSEQYWSETRQRSHIDHKSTCTHRIQN